MDFKELIKEKEYDFLRTNEHLGDNICLLGLGGSYSYGTNNENSDIDIRGIAVNTKEEILTNSCFEQVVNESTDTTIYSINKIFKLFCACNPNTIELLGLKPEHYIYKNNIGDLLLENKKLFLSKRAIHSFGGYANAQLRKLRNKSARVADDNEKVNHLFKTIDNAQYDFKQRYFPYDDSNIKLYACNDENGKNDIYVDFNLTKYPLRDLVGIFSEMSSIIKDYDKLGKRNTNAIEHNKLGKHMMHLVRLYLMCLDILEKGEINTFREKEHDFLMSIRNGFYLENNKQVKPEFYEIVNDFEKRLEYDKENTSLPDHPNMKIVNELLMEINELIVMRGNYR